MSPLSKKVEQAGIDGLTMKRQPASIGPADFFETGERVRSLFANLINVSDAQRIAILPSVSYGMAIAARNIPVKHGQNIVVLHEQFPSNIYSWLRLSDEKGVEIRTVFPPVHSAQRATTWNESILAAIDKKTIVVAVPHVHWADGTLFNLVAISEKARAVGAYFIVDGTQSVGALPFDVSHIKPDALICAGYKWLMGPYSIGLGYFGERFSEGVPLEENWIARKNSEQFSGLVAYEKAYQPGSMRFDVGERSNFILLPMLKAALDQVLEWQPSNIQQYCKEICAPSLEEIASMGFSIESSTGRASHLFGIRMAPSAKLGQVKTALKAGNISVSVRGDAIRVAPHVYNDPADAMALVTALRKCVKGG